MGIISVISVVYSTGYVGCGSQKKGSRYQGFGVSTGETGDSRKCGTIIFEYWDARIVTVNFNNTVRRYNDVR